MEFSFKHVDFGSLKALATVKIGEMEIRGFKVIQSEGEPWVGMPSREVMRDGKKEYFDIVRFAPEARKAFSDQLIEAWKKDLK